MCERSPHAALSHFTALGIKRCGYDDGIHAVLAEFGESENPVRKILILRGHAKALFNETVDADSCRRTGKEIFFSQLIGADLVYLAGFKIRRFGIQTGLSTRFHHFLSLLPFSVSFFFKKSNSSSAVT